MLPILNRKFLEEHPEVLVKVKGGFHISNKEMEDSCIDAIGYAKHRLENMLSAEIIKNGALLIRRDDTGKETIVEGCAYVVNMKDYVPMYVTKK